MSIKHIIRSTRVSYASCRNSALIIGLATAFGAATPTIGLADSFQGLGSGYLNFTRNGPLNMSADGTVVAGDVGNPPQAGRWTAATGWVNLGLLPNSSGVTEGLGLSADGTTIVGYDGNGGCGNNRAFRWTAANGMVELGFAPGANYSLAYGVNADGSVLVGDSGVCGGGTTPNRAARWTSTNGWVQLGRIARTIF